VFGSTLYGTTLKGGGFGCGTVFKLNTDGTGYQVLKEFTGSDGKYPFSGLTLFGSALYGTTFEGGDLDMGIVFKLQFLNALTSVPLTAQALGGSLILNWSDPAFNLQSASAAIGAYTNIPDATSPYTNSASGTQMFFRLIGR